MKKHHNMKDVQFFNLNYSEVNIPSNSLVYCDIPYKDTTKYSTGSFDKPIQQHPICVGICHL